MTNTTQTQDVDTLSVLWLCYLQSHVAKEQSLYLSVPHALIHGVRQ